MSMILVMQGKCLFSNISRPVEQTQIQTFLDYCIHYFLLDQYVLHTSPIINRIVQMDIGIILGDRIYRVHKKINGSDD